MTAQFLAALERKTVSDTGAGEIEGLASTYGNVDLQDDEMQPGALDKTVSDWQGSKSKVPLLDWHGDSLSRLIGSVTALASTAQGLWFRAGFGSDAESQRARQLVKDGHLSGVSIGYLPIRQSWKTVAGKAVRALHEVKLLEISLTPVPANPEAVLTSVKSFNGGPADAAGDLADLERLEAWAAAARAEQSREDMAYLVRNPESMAHIAGTLLEAKARSQLAELEAWAAAQPRVQHDPQAEARERERIRMAKANEYSFGLRAAMSRPAECAHRSCLGGRCVYMR
jgi:uncharacterized protein